MVKAKLKIQGNAPVDVSEKRKNELRRQLSGQLRPVLRPIDFDGFDLNNAFELLRSAAKALSMKE